MNKNKQELTLSSEVNVDDLLTSLSDEELAAVSGGAKPAVCKSVIDCP